MLQPIQGISAFGIDSAGSGKHREKQIGIEMRIAAARPRFPHTAEMDCLLLSEDYLSGNEKLIRGSGFTVHAFRYENLEPRSLPGLARLSDDYTRDCENLAGEEEAKTGMVPKPAFE